MRSALYYPHTTLQSEGIVRTALLLWDRLEFIVPFRDYLGDHDPALARAMELIGHPHVPTHDEKEAAHDRLVQLLDHGVPLPFLYRTTRDNYEIWPEKFMPKTWDMLRERQWAHRELHKHDYSMSRLAGLSVMAILADCCAGRTRARITDQAIAYATLVNILGSTQPDEGAQYEAIVPLTFEALDTDRIPIEKLIAYREKEQSSPNGHEYRALRHRYLQRLSDHVAELSAASRTDRDELNRAFRDDMETDFRELQEELASTTRGAFSSQEFMVAAIAAGAAAFAAAGLLPAIPQEISLTGAPVMLGGLYAASNNLAAERRRLMADHPMAYVYRVSRERLRGRRS